MAFFRFAEVHLRKLVSEACCRAGVEEHTLPAIGLAAVPGCDLDRTQAGSRKPSEYDRTIPICASAVSRLAGADSSGAQIRVRLCT
jgi:hypothetical protein